MYKTVERKCSFELVEKKSRFIAHVSPVSSEEEALAFLDAIRTEHAQARHNVYAYRLSNGRTRYSDDGEPAQTAGMPTLAVLEHAEVTDVICVTTRYFGGVLLGTGGLVRAYTQAAQGGIEKAGIVVISDCRDATIKIDYSLYDQFQRFIANTDAKVIDTDFSDRVTLVLRMKDEDAEGLLLGLRELTSGRLESELSEVFQAAI